MCVMEREREFVLVVSVSVLVVASAPSSAAKTLEGKKNKFFDLFGQKKWRRFVAKFVTLDMTLRRYILSKAK